MGPWALGGRLHNPVAVFPEDLPAEDVLGKLLGFFLSDARQVRFRSDASSLGVGVDCASMDVTKAKRMGGRRRRQRMSSSWGFSNRANDGAEEIAPDVRHAMKSKLTCQ
jgi:hypothetical protein